MFRPAHCREFLVCRVPRAAAFIAGELGNSEEADMSEESLEVPQADAVEQQAAAVPAEADADAEESVDVPLESDAADAAEQARPAAVPGDEDYR
jgi:hypothetical protein